MRRMPRVGRRARSQGRERVDQARKKHSEADDHGRDEPLGHDAGGEGEPESEDGEEDAAWRDRDSARSFPPPPSRTRASPPLGAGEGGGGWSPDMPQRGHGGGGECRHEAVGAGLVGVPDDHGRHGEERPGEPRGTRVQHGAAEAPGDEHGGNGGEDRGDTVHPDASRSGSPAVKSQALPTCSQ